MTTETEPQTTDTFTDARGGRFIAGCPVPEPVWERFHSVVDDLVIHRERGDAWREDVRAAQDEIERLTEERDLWRTLAEARNGILAAYRTGGRTPGKHIDAARAAQDRLTKLGADR